MWTPLTIVSTAIYTGILFCTALLVARFPATRNCFASTARFLCDNMAPLCRRGFLWTSRVVSIFLTWLATLWAYLISKPSMSRATSVEICNKEDEDTLSLSTLLLQQPKDPRGVSFAAETVVIEDVLQYDGKDPQVHHSDDNVPAGLSEEILPEENDSPVQSSSPSPTIAAPSSIILKQANIAIPPPVSPLLINSPPPINTFPSRPHTIAKSSDNVIQSTLIGRPVVTATLPALPLSSSNGIHRQAPVFSPVINTAATTEVEEEDDMHERPIGREGFVCVKRTTRYASGETKVVDFGAYDHIPMVPRTPIVSTAVVPPAKTTASNHLPYNLQQPSPPLPLTATNYEQPAKGTIVTYCTPDHDPENKPSPTVLPSMTVEHGQEFDIDSANLQSRSPTTSTATSANRNMQAPPLATSSSLPDPRAKYYKQSEEHFVGSRGQPIQVNNYTRDYEMTVYHQPVPLPQERYLQQQPQYYTSEQTPFTYTDYAPYISTPAHQQHYKTTLDPYTANLLGKQLPTSSLQQHQHDTSYFDTSRYEDALSPATSFVGGAEPIPAVSSQRASANNNNNPSYAVSDIGAASAPLKANGKPYSSNSIPDGIFADERFKTHSYGGVHNIRQRHMWQTNAIVSKNR